jgi:hypothetical protein
MTKASFEEPVKKFTDAALFSKKERIKNGSIISNVMMGSTAARYGTACMDIIQTDKVPYMKTIKSTELESIGMKVVRWC